MLLWAVSVGVLAATPAEKLETSVRALQDLQYAQALSSAPADTEVKGFSHEQVTAWLSTRALALAMLKREAEASAAFRQLFSVAQEWQVPDEYGPRVRTLVLEARAAAQRAGVVSLTFAGGAVQAKKDPFGFATDVELSWRAGKAAVKTVRVPLAAEINPPWPNDVVVEAWGRIVGLNGSTLATWGSEAHPQRFEPAVAVVPPEPAPAPSKIRPMFIAGIATAAVGVAGLAVGGVFMVQAGEPGRVLASATRDQQGRITSISQRDAFALEARAKQDATLGTALLVAGGIAAAAGAGLMIAGRATAAPTPGGVSVIVPLDATFRFAGVSR